MNWLLLVRYFYALKSHYCSRLPTAVIWKIMNESDISTRKNDVPVNESFKFLVFVRRIFFFDEVSQRLERNNGNKPRTLKLETSKHGSTLARLSTVAMVLMISRWKNRDSLRPKNFRNSEQITRLFLSRTFSCKMRAILK